MMRIYLVWLALSLIWAIGLTECSAISSSTRQMQQEEFPQTLNYRANYSADFQYLSDPLCDGPEPILVVTCFGPNMTILKRSNESISCTPLDVPWITNGTTYECQSSCVGTECEEVYRHKSELFDPLNGPFGSISFMCEGDNLNQVDAIFAYQGGSFNGTCEASNSTTESRRNYHIGRLGVSCPAGFIRQYVYDDTYSDCRSLGSYTEDIYFDNFIDVFACISGNRCEGTDDCSFEFLDFRIEADVPRFYKTCVESLVDTTFPTRAPIPETSSSKFVTRFKASWGSFYEPLSSNAFCSGSETLDVVISCDISSTLTIDFNATENAASCSQTRSNEMRCSSNELSSRNGFVSAFYQCAGPQPPSSIVTLQESPMFCENNVEAALVQHVVSLGIACESASTGMDFFFYDDLVFECAEASHDFLREIDVFGTSELRLFCIESALFPIGSKQNNTVEIPTVGMSTNDYWLTGVNDNCYDKVSPLAPTPPEPVITPITSAPSLAPVATPIASAPTLSPSDVPTVKPTKAPVAVPVILPSAAAPVPMGNTSDSGGAVIGAAVGGVAAGVLVMALIGFLVLRKKPTGGASPKGAVAMDRRPSATESGTVNGNGGVPSTDFTRGFASSTSSPMPTTSLIQARNYQVEYKDQSRTVINPGVAPYMPTREDMPIAVAVNVEPVSQIRSSSRRAQPPGARFEDEFG